MTENNADSIQYNMRKGRILLIYPPSPILRHNRDTINNCESGCYNKHLPLDLLYLASIAEQCEYEAKISICENLELLITNIIAFQPDYILADVTTPTFKFDMQALQKIKELFPQIKIIVKGESFFTYNANAIYEQTFLDYVIFNEAETTLKMLLFGYAEEEINGLCYRENYQAVKTEKPDLINNLDDLPLPARHLIENNDYKNTLNNKVQTTIELSRGCTKNCVDCLETAICGANVRTRSVESIINEINECINKYKISQFYFKTSAGAIEKSSLIYLCKRIIEANLKISWLINLDLSMIDKELVQSLKQAGCFLCNIRVNSNVINIDFKEFNKSLNLLKNSHIDISCNIIIGYPEDNKEGLTKLIKYIKDINCDLLKLTFPRPLPGTQLFNYVLLNHMTNGKMDFTNSIIVPTTKTIKLSLDELVKFKQKALKTFYLNPTKIFKILFSPYIKIYYKIILNIIKNMFQQ